MRIDGKDTSCGVYAQANPSRTLLNVQIKTLGLISDRKHHRWTFEHSPAV